MNKKVVKLRAERANNDDKIATLQSRNEEIDRQIIELENTDIIGMVRESGLTPDKSGFATRRANLLPPDAQVLSEGDGAN